MKEAFFMALGADVEDLRDNINAGLVAGKLIRVKVGKADPNSELFRLIMNQSRERKEQGYDPNPLTWEDRDEKGNKSQHTSWAIDRFLLQDGGTYPLLVEGFSTPVREDHKRIDRIEVWNGFSSDPTVPKPACTIQWGTEEDRLLTEIYPKENETFGLELERRLGLQDLKTLYRVKNGSRNVFLSKEGEIFVANDSMKDRYDDNPNLTVEAISSILTMIWEAIPMGFRWAFVNQFVMFGDGKSVMCVDPHQRTYYFKKNEITWDEDWINIRKDLDEFTNKVVIPESIPSQIKEVLDEVQTSQTKRAVTTLYNGFISAQVGRKSKTTALDAEDAADPDGFFVRIVEDDPHHCDFSYRCDMKNRILVDRSVRYKVKSEWKEKVVFCYEDFPRGIPSCWSFPEGNINITEVLEDRAEVTENTVYTGGGHVFVNLRGSEILLNNPHNDRRAYFVKIGSESKCVGPWFESQKLPLIDWERTLEVRPGTTVGDLRAGRFYCWVKGYDQLRSDQNHHERTSVWMVEDVNFNFPQVPDHNNAN